MNYMKNLIKGLLSLAVILCFTGCSYISNEIDENISKRSSFTGEGSYDKSSHTVKITWEETWSTADHFEIFRTSEPDDEFSDYEYIGSCSSDETSYTDHLPLFIKRGLYFYRIAKIVIDDEGESSIDEASGYIEVRIE